MAWLSWVRRGAAVIGLSLAAASAALAAPTTLLASPIEGVWLTAELTEMTISPCPTGYCGYISKIVVPDKIKRQYGAELERLDPASFTDVNNKDPQLKGRPIQGLQILTLWPTKNPYYYEGEIYNPQDGNVYSGSIELMRADIIKLKGCVLYVLCQEQEWKRIPQPEPED